jgi:hypothetical protein
MGVLTKGTGNFVEMIRNGASELAAAISVLSVANSVGKPAPYFFPTQLNVPLTKHSPNSAHLGVFTKKKI